MEVNSASNIQESEKLFCLYCKWTVFGQMEYILECTQYLLCMRCETWLGDCFTYQRWQEQIRRGNTGQTRLDLNELLEPVSDLGALRKVTITVAMLALVCRNIAGLHPQSPRHSARQPSSPVLTNPTVFVTELHEYSYYVSRQTVLPPQSWMQKHIDLRAHDFAHCTDFWHESP
jgi:hypothetical protein